MIGRMSPGECPVCGAAHTTCTASTGPILISQTPARDSADADVASVPLVSEIVQATLPAGSYTTGTYRDGLKKRRT